MLQGGGLPTSRSADQSELCVAGVDGCPAGWVAFKVDIRTRLSQVEVADLRSWLRCKPNNLATLVIDIPIGLLDGPRPCTCAARKLLGFPRCSSVFAAPCRAVLNSACHSMANDISRSRTGKGLSIQAWAIAPKIKEIDDIIQPVHQNWIFEVHPEVSFWRMNGLKPMVHSKSRSVGKDERRSILSQQFPDLGQHIERRPRGVGADDLLVSSGAAWSALRLLEGSAESVCTPIHDARGLRIAIHY